MHSRKGNYVKSLQEEWVIFGERKQGKNTKKSQLCMMSVSE